METLNVKRDIEAAATIIENADKISGSDYDHYSKIFNLPTIQHKPLFNEMGDNWESFLGVLGSSDPWLNAVCKGSKNIVTFDVNCLNVYFAYLKIAGILTLNYQEFLAYFYATNWDQYFCKEYYDKLKDNLPNEIQAVWNYLYEKYPFYKIRKLFYHQISPNSDEITKIIIPNNIFLEEKEFYRLKKLLTKIKFNYFIGDFGEIPDTFYGQTFDIIYLSCMNNLIYDNVHGYNYFEKLKEFEPLAKQSGVIQGGYFYDYQNEGVWLEYATKKFNEQGYESTEVCFLEDSYDIAFIKKRIK